MIKTVAQYNKWIQLHEMDVESENEEEEIEIQDEVSIMEDQKE